MTRPPVRAVFFDVDFTLIYPGPTFQGEGYQRFCAAYGIAVDPNKFLDAVIAASPILHDEQALRHQDELFIRYTRRIIEVMGGTPPSQGDEVKRILPKGHGATGGDALDACATEIVREWAACQHFFLYDDVAPVLRELDARRFKVGLISNSHRCLASFQQHFELNGLITAAISSSEHGFLKPHPSIFEAALRLVGVRPEEALMVGDSLTHDIEGARRVGMRGVLVRRARNGAPAVDGPADVPVIRTLAELPSLI
jgi:HAD superfamily hydrolase (TIGR01662 family)